MVKKMANTMTIYCCGCDKKVEPTLVYGKDVYPHRKDLQFLPFWRCDVCNNFVGCHHKTSNPTAPLGCIPTHELRKARGHIHRILDPIWQKKIMSRKEIYALISKELGWKYHTAKLRTVEEARVVYKLLMEIR